MQIDDNKIKEVTNKLENALDTISTINSWLPQAINDAADRALN